MIIDRNDPPEAGERDNEMKNRVNKIRRTAAVLLAIASMALPMSSIPSAAAEAEGIELYVSTTGDDTASGTISDPLRSLEGARNAIRELRKSGDPEGGITVWLREGVYRQENTLIFSSADSGTEDCPITYAAYNGESVTVTGGVTLDPDKFTVPGDDIKARLQTERAKNNVLAYDLGAEDVNCSPIDTTQGGAVRVDSRLYYDGVRGWTGRYPNYVHGDSCFRYFAEPSGNTFLDLDNKVKNWAPESIEGARMYGMFGIDWVDSYAVIVDYNASTDRITIEGNASPAKSGRYFFYNVLEEVDAVGEYYLDAETGMLYFYAPANYESIPLRFATCRGNVIDANVSYYTFDGLTIECGVDSIINFTGDNNTVQNCTVRDSSESGISFTGDGNVVYNNEICYIGAAGITGKMTNSIEMKHSKTLIDNNAIHDFAEIHRVYNGAINIGEVRPGSDGGYGVTVSHNEMYYGPHLAISYLSRDSLFEYNYIHNVCYEAGDAGAIYDGTWLSNGMVFRNNIIKDINSVNTSYPQYAIYLNPLGYYCDDSGAGKHVYSNLFINIDGPAIATSGQDNNIHDNIIIAADKGNSGARAISADSRNYYKLPNNSVSGWEDIAVFKSDTLHGLWQWLMHPGFNPAYGTEKWAYSYPWTMLLKTTNVYDQNDRFVSYAYGDSKVRQNALYPSSANVGATGEFQAHVEIRDNVALDEIADFGFVNYSGGDYRISENSRLYRALPGFKPCDAANVGRITTQE